MLLLAPPAQPRRFHDDDPLGRVPPPRPVRQVVTRQISEAYDFVANTFAAGPSEPPEVHNVRAESINTLDEVPDSEWFVNRHARRRLSAAELRAGAGESRPPDASQPWHVTAIKRHGTPGFFIRDAQGRRYLVKLDPPDHPELASGAEVAGSRFFHAMGYFVPENYIVRFPPAQLQVDPEARMPKANGGSRPMVAIDVYRLLRDQPRDDAGRIRAVASLYLPGEPVGPFRYSGTRSDDPNDTVDHEHRRELRGLVVPAAWLNHTDITSLNTLDTLVEEGGRRHLRHHLLDFGSILGSDSIGPKSPRSGHVGLVQAKPALLQVFTLGAWIPDWTRARYPEIPGVGRFEADFFNPARWQPNYPLHAFRHARPDDTFWGTKLILAFQEEDIRLILSTAEYTDPRAAEWIASALLVRREKLARYHLSRVLPLDNFRIEEGAVRFDDLAVVHRLAPPSRHFYQWSRFDNETERYYPVSGATTAAMPPPLAALPDGQYAAVVIHSGEARKHATAFFRRRGGAWQLVGVERGW